MPSLSVLSLGHVHTAICKYVAVTDRYFLQGETSFLFCFFFGSIVQEAEKLGHLSTYCWGRDNLTTFPSGRFLRALGCFLVQIRSSDRMFWHTLREALVNKNEAWWMIRAPVFLCHILFCLSEFQFQFCFNYSCVISSCSPSWARAGFSFRWDVNQSSLCFPYSLLSVGFKHNQRFAGT